MHTTTRTRKFKLLSIACAVALSAIAHVSHAADQVFGNKENIIDGLVVGVHDGDTITVLDKNNTQFKIRLTGIDAPELDQDFGKKSKWSLSDAVFQHQVRVFYHTRDMYGRVLGQVFVNGVDANMHQVDSGLAWAYRSCNKIRLCFPNEDSAPYVDHETAAKKAVLGLWQQPNPEAPWNYRKSNKH